MKIEHYHPNSSLSLETPVAFQQKYKLSNKIAIFYTNEKELLSFGHSCTVAVWRYKPKTNEIPSNNRTSL